MTSRLASPNLRVRAVTIAIGVAFAMSALVPAHAADKTIRIGVSDPVASARGAAFLEFKKHVEERSGKAMEVQVFPSNQLGKEQQQMENVKTGSQEIYAATTAWFSAFYPPIEVFDLPFLITSWEGVDRLVKSDVSREILADAEKATGIKIAGWMPVGFRNVWNRKHPINDVADFRGMKIRLQNSKVHLAMFKAMGANPVSLPAQEIYQSIQTGVIDAAEGSAAALHLNKYVEVAPYVSKTQHLFTAMLVYVNKRFYDGMTAQQKQIFDQSMEIAVAKQRELAKAEEDDSLAGIAKAGGKINEVSPDARAKLLAAVKPVYDEFGAKFEPRTTQILKAVQGN